MTVRLANPQVLHVNKGAYGQTLVELNSGIFVNTSFARFKTEESQFISQW
jgi:hypothetical protein